MPPRLPPLEPRPGPRPEPPSGSLDRRQLLAGGGALLAAPLAAQLARRSDGDDDALDRLLAAHAALPPERPGAGANHYPMAAEALEALGRPDAIDPAWTIAGAELYAAPLTREGDLEEPPGALGSYARHGDWLDLFRRELARSAWREVVREWAPRLAPGLAGAAFHGLIRTAHAARALRRRESAARSDELAAGLAYWAARYAELPPLASERARGADLAATLAVLEHPWLEDASGVGFFDVTPRLTERPLAPFEPPAPGVAPRAALDRLVRAAATGFLEMLIQERHRIWLLHAVTGPAAVGLLLPDVDDAGARRLVGFAHQAVLALFSAFGAPFTPREHVGDAPGSWPAALEAAAASGSVHTIKLIEALARFDRAGEAAAGAADPLLRAVADRWLAWK